MDKKILFTSGLLSTVVVGLMNFTHIPAREAIAAVSQTIPVPFTELLQGEHSAIATRVNYLVTSPEELQALWKLVGATSTPPQVDFAKQAVIAVFAGKEPKAAISIAKVEDANARLVSIVVKKPDSTCTASKAMVSPFEVVALAATSLPLTHEDIVTTTSCSN